MSLFSSKVERMSPGEALLDVKMAEFVKELGLGIAAAQHELDANSVEMALRLAQTTPPFSNKSLIELGLSPSFYHFESAEIEVKMSLKMMVSQEVGFDLGLKAGDWESHASSSTGQRTGTAALQVVQGEDTPATAIVQLAANSGTGSIEVGGETFELVVPQSGNYVLGANQVEPSATIKATAEAFAAKIDNLDGIESVTVEIVPGTQPVTLSTANPDSFAITSSRVQILQGEDEPAYGWIEVKDNVASTFTWEVTTGGNSGSAQVGIAASGGDVTLASSLAATTQAFAHHLDGLTQFTAKALVIDSRCPTTVRFDDNQSTIRPDAMPALNEMLRFLKHNPSVRIRCEGHASTPGGTTHNQNLSETRAEVIRDWLLNEGGFASNRVTAQGFGETQPLGTVPESRRVEFRVTSSHANVVALVTTATGDVQIDDLTFASASTFGAKMATVDGVMATPEPGDMVTVGGTAFTVATSPASQTEFQRGTTAAATASNLADAIEALGSGLTAVANGDTVTVGGNGSAALLTLTTAAKGTVANATAITAAGQFSIEQGFQGGEDALGPEEGDQVVVNGVAFTCKTGATASGVQGEFKRGADAAETAANLAAVMNQKLTDFSASPAGDTITVAGPGGSAVSTTHPTAFVWSASQVGKLQGLKKVTRKSFEGWGIAVNAHYHRKYALEMSGTSRLQVKMLAIPAPTELLDEIRAYLGG